MSLKLSPQLTEEQDVTLKSLLSLSYVTRMLSLTSLSWEVSCSAQLHKLCTAHRFVWAVVLMCSLQVLWSRSIARVNLFSLAYICTRTKALGAEGCSIQCVVRMSVFLFFCLFPRSSRSKFCTFLQHDEAVTSPAAVMLHHKRDHRFVWQY